MYKLKIKNFIRLLIALFLKLIPTFSKKKFIYCNLQGKNKVGGPDRFLKTILASSSLKESYEVEYWDLSKCKSALVFSASWGNSFAKLAKFFKVKTILRVDGFYVPDDLIDEEFQHPLDYRQYVNERLKNDLEKFDHIIYQSQFSKDICDRYLYMREKHYSIIHNGTNLKRFFPKNTERSIPKLLMLGKHYPKHLKLAAEVIEKILESMSVELHIIGPLRNGEDKVQAFIQTMNLSSKTAKAIKCHGIVYYDELPTQIQNCDILLHAKIGDWCPNAVIEAMACGLPVLCPSWGGTKELVGDSGISIEGPEWGYNPQFVDEMAQAFFQIWQNYETYREKTLQRVQSEFNIEKISKDYLSSIES